jgi:hypothetical protein
VVLRRWEVSFRSSESLDLLLWPKRRVEKQLRVDAKYERGIDRLARAADFGRILVQSVEVI